MINTFKNLQVTKHHNIFIKNLPLKAGEIVDVMVIPRNNKLLSKLPLDGVPLEYSDPFEPAINPNDWSATKGQPKNLNEDRFKQLHKDLKNLSVDLLEHYNNSVGKYSINTHWLKEFINPPQQVAEISNKVVQYFDHYALHKKNEISLASYKKLNVVKHLIERFQKETKTEYLIKDIDANFKLHFETFCLKENYAPNTIARTINFIKTICLPQFL